jgi:hypothetical protein
MKPARWVGRSSAAREYGLTIDQIDYAILQGLIRYRDLGGHGVIVSRDDLEKNLDAIKGFPERIWIYKSEAMRRYGLTRNQVELALEMGLIRFKKVRNPYYSKSEAVLLVIPDIEANLDVIRGFPRYSEWERSRRRIYAGRSKLRRNLEFHCPRCGMVLRPPRGSQAFEAVWSGIMDASEALERIIVAHYRHAHTAYDRDRENIDMWLREEDLKEIAPNFKSYTSLLKWYLEHKHDMDEWEREHYIGILNTLRSIAVERAKKHYTEEAIRLAEADGLLRRKQEQLSTQESTPQ